MRRGGGGGFAGPRPTPEQMALNQALVACSTAAKVLDMFDLALEDGIEASTVNIVTAIHRVAKTLSPAKDALALRSDPSALKRSDRFPYSRGPDACPPSPIDLTFPHEALALVGTVLGEEI